MQENAHYPLRRTCFLQLVEAYRTDTGTLCQRLVAALGRLALRLSYVSRPVWFFNRLTKISG